MDLSFVTLPSSCNLSKHYSCALREGEGNLGLLTEWDWRLLPLALYKLNTILYSKSVRERSLAFPQRSPSRGRPCCGAPPAAPPASADGRDGCMGPMCVTHARPLDRCVDGRR